MLRRCRALYVFQCRDNTVFNVFGNAGVKVVKRCLSSSKIESWVKKYEGIVGLSEVKTAQDKVIGAEKMFQKTQDQRRQCQKELIEVQNRIRGIHGQLDKLQRGDERYLALLTEEYDILKKEKVLLQDLKHWEQAEHDHFAALSSALRESHEKERFQSERTKYWSITGSIIGAAIGIIGTSINNRLKMRELKAMVETGSVNNYELKNILGQLSQVAQAQYGQTVSFLSDLQMLLMDDGPSDKRKLPLKLASESTNELTTDDQFDVQTIKQQEKKLDKDFEIVQKLLKASKQTKERENVVYVGPELAGIFKEMEENIEWDIKKNALMTTGLLYGAGLLTFSVIYFIFRSAA